MKKIVLSTMAVYGMFLCVGSQGFAAEQKAPNSSTAAASQAATTVISDGKASTPVADSTDMSITLRAPLFSNLFDEFPVALVNDEPITLAELTTSLAGIHQSGDQAPSGKNSLQMLLDRLINSRLIVLEAENMGLEEMPEVKQAISDYLVLAPRETLKKQQLKGLKPDEAVVQQFYRDAVKEWKIKSVKFAKEDDAKAFAAEVEAGGDFNELSNKAIDSGKAEGDKEGSYTKGKDLLPQVVQFVSTTKTGKVSPVIHLPNGFAILKVEDIRYPENNEEALATARQQALGQKQAETLRKYMDTLAKKYTKVDEKLLKKLNFNVDTKTWKKLEKDKRVVVRIKGDKPILVSDLTEAISMKFFHGVDEAVKQKRADEQKYPTVQDLIYKRIYNKEALVQGIAKSPDFQKKIKEYKASILFGAFIKKVVEPEVKVSDEETKKYFNEHITDYSTPEMLRLKSLAFTKKDMAETAIEKLRKGTEFQWLKANAEGQVPEDKEGLIVFDGNVLTTKSLTEKIKEAVASAKRGDVKLAATPDGLFYVIVIQDIIPAKPEPFDEHKKAITQKLFYEKLNKALDNWGVKLREAYKVKTFLVGSSIK
jgi:parvulin-like peptidyl-prolyl isomerase